MELPFCALITVCAGITLLIFYFKNKDRRIERYFHKNNKELFLLLQLSYFILIVSFAYNSRFLMSKILSFGTTYLKKRLGF
jgi:hypothetical protein